jgi:WD40 repeat protein
MLWDLTKQGTQSSIPKLINKGSWHDGGIWSMHSMGDLVVTGSKDGSLSFGTIESTQGVTLTHNEDIGMGQIKGVNIQTNGSGGGGGGGGTLRVAAACEDGSVMVLDGRSPQVGQGSLHIRGAHGGRGCMSVEWQPGNEHVLLSAGLDATIKVYVDCGRCLRRLWEKFDFVMILERFLSHFLKLPLCVYYHYYHNTN